MKVKYFLRGLGIGILVTTLLLFAGAKKDNTNTLTDAEIMERASELGMLTEEEVNDYRLDESLDSLKESLTATSTPVVTTDVSPSPSVEETEKTSPSPSAEETTEKTSSPSPSPSPSVKKETKTITIEIEAGMVSQSIAKYLYQKNVIGSASDFNNYMLEHKVTQKIRAGTYEIPTEVSYAEIVEIIT